MRPTLEDARSLGSAALRHFPSSPESILSTLSSLPHSARRTYSAIPAFSTLPSLLATCDINTRTFLSAHAKPLRTATEALRLTAVIAPAAESELRAEAAAALVALLTVYRDAGGPGARRAPPPVIALEALRAIELLLEMRARRGGRRGWSIIAAVEAAKAVLRLAILVRRGGRILTQSAEELPPTPEPPACSCGLRDVPGADKVCVIDGPRSGRKFLRLDPDAFPATPAGALPPEALDALFVTAYERRSAWLMRMFVSPGGCEACDPALLAAAARERETERARREAVLALSAPRREEVLAEVLYIIRPLLHLMLIRRFGWQSWRALGTAFAVDGIARQLMARSREEEVVDERNRRMLLLLLYLARSPLFDHVAKVILRRLERTVSRVPLVGTAAASMIDLLASVQRFWFYTSAS